MTDDRSNARAAARNTYACEPGTCACYEGEPCQRLPAWRHWLANAVIFGLAILITASIFAALAWAGLHVADWLRGFETLD